MRPVVFGAAVVLCAVCGLQARRGTAPSLDDSRVHIPWKDFKEIVDELSATVKVGPSDTVFAPEPFVISEVTCKGVVVDNNAARMTAKAAITVLPSQALRDNGWVEIPVGSAASGAGQLERVTVNGTPASVKSDRGRHVLLLSRTGTYTVSLDYYTPVRRSEGTHELHVHLPKAAAISLDLLIPGIRAEVEVGGKKRQARVSAAGTRFEGPVASASPLRLRYTPSADSEGNQDDIAMTPKVFANTSMLVGIKENRIKYRYRVDYEIWHKKRSSFSVLLPDTAPIENIHGAGLASWDATDTDSGQLVVVKTSFSPDRAWSFTMEFSQKLTTASATIRVPAPRVLDVNRESGHLAVQASETMEVFAGDSTLNVSGVAPAALPSWLQSQKDVLLRYKYNRRPFRLVLDVRRHQDMPVLVAVADEALFTVLATEQGHLLAKYRYKIRNNQKQYLRVTMPEGWVLWSSLIDGRAVMPASTEVEGDVLVPLRKMGAGESEESFVLELVYWKKNRRMGPMGRLRLACPVVDVNCQKINGKVYVPRRHKYGKPGGDFEKTGHLSGTLSDQPTVTYTRRNDSTRMPAQSMVFSNTMVTKSSGKRAVALPVEIEVPHEGRAIAVTRSLTVAGEEVSLSLGYRREAAWLARAIGFLLWLLSMAVAYVMCRDIVENWGTAPMRGTIVSGFVAVFVMSLLAQWANGMGLATFWCSLLVGVLALLAFAANPARKEAAS